MEGPIEEDVEEADKEMDVREAPPTRESVPRTGASTTGQLC